MALTTISQFVEELSLAPLDIVPVDIAHHPQAILYWKENGFPLGQFKTEYPGDTEEHSLKVDPPSTNFTLISMAYWKETSTPVKISGDPWLARSTALAYVNTARVALGYAELKRLPTGTPGNGNECVLARALPECVSVGSSIRFGTRAAASIVARAWATTSAGDALTTPTALIEFINHFDARHYRDLIVA